MVIQHFTANDFGIDYVVGDIHGEFDLLQGKLDALKFDPAVDRLFSVGDLVDRGRNSLAALRWWPRPWFHAVLGNHEDMLLVADVDIRKSWFELNGGEWWLDLDKASRERFRSVVAQLPLAIEIETTQGTVGIVHADVPAEYSWPEFVRRLDRNDNEARRYALWSRARVHGDVTTAAGEIYQVYCGHTPVPYPFTVENVHFIDTGACYGGPLTALPLLHNA